MKAATKLQQCKALAVGTFLQILSLSPGTFRELSGDVINSCTSSDYRDHQSCSIFSQASRVLASIMGWEPDNRHQCPHLQPHVTSLNLSPSGWNSKLMFSTFIFLGGFHLLTNSTCRFCGVLYSARTDLWKSKDEDKYSNISDNQGLCGINPI